jgi:CBS domain containing-hemolysin-like protein
MSELAIASSRKARLERCAKEDDRRARLALELVSNRDQPLSTGPVSRSGRV